MDEPIIIEFTDGNQLELVFDSFSNPLPISSNQTPLDAIGELWKQNIDGNILFPPVYGKQSQQFRFPIHLLIVLIPPQIFLQLTSRLQLYIIPRKSKIKNSLFFPALSHTKRQNPNNRNKCGLAPTYKGQLLRFFPVFCLINRDFTFPSYRVGQSARHARPFKKTPFTRCLFCCLCGLISVGKLPLLLYITVPESF